ncbi:MAG TPA: putative dsRNA-binding protein, partial [Chloroflexota bacterium]|nr:putative dsRNA-binding protein [Chloroflexota bacterium]
AEHIRVSRGEATLEGRGRQSILAGTVEAIVAAAYLDAGLDATRDLVHRLIEPRLEVAPDEVQDLNVKGHLQEVIQASRGVTPRYRVAKRSGPVHAEHFVVEVVAGDEVLGRGEGVGKRQAEVNAAREALDTLDAEELEPETGE